MDLNQFMWVEKYRPQTIGECILTPDLKEYLKSLVDGKEIPNLLLTGDAGCGKTTVAKALCNEIGADWLFINGSEDSGIDTLRNNIRQFASTRSLHGETKVVIIDEADYLNPNSFQPAFRAFLEEFASNCRFILTCNNKNRIIKPILSRLTVIDFKLKPEDKPVIAKQFFKRVVHILKAEEVEVNNEIVAAIITKFFPDFRKTIVELQKNIHNGVLSNRILSNENIEVDELVSFLKSKDWSKMREWVAKNLSDYDANDMFRVIYDKVSHLTDQSPHLILLIATYQYKAAFVADQEINFVAFLTEVMTNCEFT